MSLTGIYEFFSRRRGVRRVSLALLTALLAGLVSLLHFSEDISDFLPLGTREREQLSVYQRISGADRLYLLFSNPGDADETIGAIDSFLEIVAEKDTEHWCDRITAQIDMETIQAVSDFVYDNAPYFTTASDIERMDSLLSQPDYIRTVLARDRQALMFPSSSLVSGSITRDPLGLFSPVLSRLQSSSGQVGFEMYDNYIFTPDMSRAVVLMDSPFGSSETDNNARLLALLEASARQMGQEHPEVSVDIIGGPAIAVGNSSRIKKDSILAISLSAVLILLLLFYSFNSLRNILLVFLTVGWGLLFALGGMALLRGNVSIIVIGISSVILGIAINYPLHLISHTAHQPDRRKALMEIVSPLVVGNITTVGAFLALAPLPSTALRDLGLFASLLLVGTIFFVLLYLPHYVSDHRGGQLRSRLLDRLAALQPENSRSLVIVTGMITTILLIHSFRTEFDGDMSHINYMTSAQRRDMQYFEDLLTHDTTRRAQTLYVYGSGAGYDEALRGMERRESLVDSLAAAGLLARQNDALSFVTSTQEQRRRLDLWKDFVSRHALQLGPELEREAAAAGFSAGAFSRFHTLVERSFEPQEMAFFEPLLETVFTQNFTHVDGTAYAVCPVNVEPEQMETVKQAFGDGCFEVAGINRAMTGSLSDNFNYIGWACSLIVFFFLWFSFGRIELALISFLPMAVSWVWILGLMSMLGIKFNIVNIILATFIFGQGDDYTIFMTEGCQYEYSRRRPILASYKSSILQSAAIMLVGIGTLIVARHPAMRSLAEVTIIGMFSVVLMAYLIPPLLFKWMTEGRAYPLTLRSLLSGAPSDPVARVAGRYIYMGKDIERCVRRNLKASGEVILRSPVAPVVEREDSGYGELSLLLALSHPEVRVIAHIADEEKRLIAMSAASLVSNIEFKK